MWELLTQWCMGQMNEPSWEMMWRTHRGFSLDKAHVCYLQRRMRWTICEILCTVWVCQFLVLQNTTCWLQLPKQSNGQQSTKMMIEDCFLFAIVQSWHGWMWVELSDGVWPSSDREAQTVEDQTVTHWLVGTIHFSDYVADTMIGSLNCDRDHGFPLLVVRIGSHVSSSMLHQQPYIYPYLKLLQLLRWWMKLKDSNSKWYTLCLNRWKAGKTITGGS